MQKHRWIVLSAFVVAAASSPSAAADDSATVATTNAHGIIYNFADDPLQAGGLEPLGARIQIAKGAARETLIRPRTAFVSELLRSVEHL